MYLNENGNEFLNKIKILFWIDFWIVLLIKVEELVIFKFGIWLFSV